MRQLKIYVNFSRLFFAWVLVVASVIGLMMLLANSSRVFPLTSPLHPKNIQNK